MTSRRHNRSEKSPHEYREWVSLGFDVWKFEAQNSYRDAPKVHQHQE